MQKEYMVLMDNGEFLDGVISEEKLYDLRMSKEPFFYFKGDYYNKYKIEKIILRSSPKINIVTSDEVVKLGKEEFF